VIYFGVFPHMTLNGYYDVMGITAAECNDVIHIFPIQTMTEATWGLVKGTCLWYGAMTQSKTYTDI